MMPETLAFGPEQKTRGAEGYSVYVDVLRVDDAGNLGDVVKVGRLLRRQWERVWDFYVIGKYGPAQQGMS